jgi:hypothetical protein
MTRGMTGGMTYEALISLRKVLARAGLAKES